MRKLGIGDLARRVRMQPSALRYYESVGLLTPAERVGADASIRSAPCAGSR